jgi:meiotically up-regulated gene 157 (Mug157) protein
MIWTAFRPSDDRARYGFNVAQQMLAITALDDLGALAMLGFDDARLADDAATIAADVRAGVERYGLVYRFGYGLIYAFEVDGRGNALVADDANMPNLLSAPLSGFSDSGDAHYIETRRFSLSSDNPYYYRGRLAEGLGSPHTPPGWVWPLGMIARAMTATSQHDTLRGLRMLARIDGPDGLVHESVDPNDTSKFTRAEFGWANAMYAELLFRSAAGFPAPILAPPAFPTIAPLPWPATPYAVGPLDRLVNMASLIDTFERAVPLPVIGPDDMSNDDGDPGS